MSADKEIEVINGEKVLADVLHIVCKYAKFKDLISMAGVCKTWRRAAIHESTKRVDIQHFYLPFDMDDLDRRLYVNPMASLLIYDYKLEKSPLPLCFPDFDGNDRVLTKEILEKFKWQVPKKLIILGVDEHVTTFDAEHLKPHPDAPTICDYQQSQDDAKILGIFFPSKEQRIQVHVAGYWRMPWPQDHPKRIEATHRLAIQLGLKDSTDKSKKSTIIQFALLGGRDHTLIGELGAIARRRGKEITWSSIFGSKLMFDCCRNESFRPDWTTCAFLRISGPSVESWSTFFHLCSGLEEIRGKLDELSAQVTRKRNNIGFIYAPVCGATWCTHNDHPCGDSLEMLVTLNRAIPDVKFTGFFVDCNVYTRMEDHRRRRVFAHGFDDNDARNFNRDFLNRLPYFASVLVVTYD